ncbi:hypothetical protein IF2G_09436 [Cordyceps javanica]|nr:hypothetical protein IF2G_09436 [Cordyceps javanica]
MALASLRQQTRQLVQWIETLPVRIWCLPIFQPTEGRAVRSMSYKACFAIRDNATCLWLMQRSTVLRAVRVL